MSDPRTLQHRPDESPYAGGAAAGAPWPHGAATRFDRVDEHLIVRISGEIDQDQTPALVDAIRGEMRPDDVALLLNLAEVTFCGSAGLGIFLQLKSMGERSSMSFAIVDPSPVIKAMLAVCGLNDEIRVWGTT
jgi:anti-sigma B factor antagonist